MRDNDAEALSALMDGEATELELRALVRDAARDPELAAKWSRYHLASAVLHKQLAPANPRSLASVDLAGRVAQALAEEPDAPPISDGPVPVARGQRWRQAINVAVAASVALAVVAGWEFARPGAPAAAGLAQATASARSAMGPGAVMPVSTGQNLPVSLQSATRSQPVADIPADDRFNRYLISHSGNAALATHGGAVSYVRVVTLKPAGAGVHH
jgi:sigma-E factor negative regulatory protein RseA